MEYMFEVHKAEIYVWDALRPHLEARFLLDISRPAVVWEVNVVRRIKSSLYDEMNLIRF